MTKQLRLILTSFFPRLRREFHWQDLWPLAAFLAVFCGVCAWLESAHHLMFSRPLMLGLIVFAPWIWWMHLAGYAGLPKNRSQLALLMRLCLLGLLVMVLASMLVW